MSFDVSKAQQMREAGVSWAGIARRLGVGIEPVRRAIEPGYAERRATGVRLARWLLRREMNRAPGRSETVSADKISHSTYMSPGAKRDAERMVAQIPVDTRSLTARLAGDPVFERSALFKKHSDRIE